MENKKRRILDRSSELTYSGIRLSGDSQFIRNENGDFFAIIDNTSTEDSILESLYIFDCIGFNIDEISFSNEEFFIIKDDVDKDMLEECLYKYKMLYRIEKDQIYDYDEIEYENDLGYKYIGSDVDENIERDAKVAFTAMNLNQANRNGRIYPKEVLGNEAEKRKDNLKVFKDAQLKIEFDVNKFKSLKAEDVVLNIMDFIEDDMESATNMKILNDKIESMFCEYMDMMNKNITDIDAYNEIHFKRIQEIESERIKMKEHKINRIFEKMESKAKILCEDVKETETAYTQNIVAAVLSFKRVTVTAITNLLNDVFDPYVNKIRDQHEVVLNILKMRGDE